jgi:hypothetical protein
VEAVAEGAALREVQREVLCLVVGPADSHLVGLPEGLVDREVVHQGQRDHHRVPTDPDVAPPASPGVLSSVGF